ncbi:hypothetical protein ACFL4Z_00730 [candidate division KSB1 bacterium]
MNIGIKIGKFNILLCRKNPPAISNSPMSISGFEYSDIFRSIPIPLIRPGMIINKQGRVITNFSAW